MSLLTFQPDPATADAILQAIAADYSLSLTDIANQHNTTIEALTAWLTRDDIDERLSAIESACARRARLTAANHLPAVAHVAKQALEEASDVLRLPPDYRTQRSIALRIRATESARKAAALLLRIANFTPGPRRVRHHAAPTTPRVMPPPALSSVPHSDIEPTKSPSAPPTECAPAAPAAEPHAEIEPSTSPSAPRTESTHIAPAAAPYTESTSSATTDAVATDRALSAPIAATPTNRAQSAPAAELPISRVQSATICDPQSQIAPKTSPSAPPTNRAQSAPSSLPPAESTPSDPISLTSAACSTSAPHAAPPRHASNSHAIPAWFTLVKPSAVPAPRWSPAPQSHPPPRTPTAETTRASFTPA